MFETSASALYFLAGIGFCTVLAFGMFFLGALYLFSTTPLGEAIGTMVSRFIGGG